MNFAEQLGYWYLRLNGFFPLANFVQHQVKRTRTTDTDLLALRLPHVAEEIGGAAADWDSQFQSWGIDLSRPVALIVEVKSGAWDPKKVVTATFDERTERSLKRTGLFPEKEVGALVPVLRDTAIAKSDSGIAARLLISVQPPPEKFPFLHLPLERAEGFIRDRFQKFRQRKAPDRLFFPGDLIQYLAWQSGIEVPDDADSDESE